MFGASQKLVKVINLIYKIPVGDQESAFNLQDKALREYLPISPSDLPGASRGIFG